MYDVYSTCCLGSSAPPSPRKNNSDDTDYLILARKGGGHSGMSLMSNSDIRHKLFIGSPTQELCRPRSSQDSYIYVLSDDSSLFSSLLHNRVALVSWEDLTKWLGVWK